MMKKQAVKDVTGNYHSLYDAILSLESAGEIEMFMQDLCTPVEVRNFKERWLVAQMLKSERLSYREIAAKVGASTTTVGRVARFLNNEPYQGYSLALKRLGVKYEK